jgi:hypothetical protein
MFLRNSLLAFAMTLSTISYAETSRQPTWGTDISHEFVKDQPRENVKLTYGIPDSEAVWFIVSCYPASKLITLIPTRIDLGMEPDQKAQVDLSIAGAHLSFQGVAIDDGDGGILFTVNVPSAETLAPLFVKPGVLKVSLAKKHDSFAIGPKGMSAFSKFLEHCGSANHK